MAGIPAVSRRRVAAAGKFRSTAVPITAVYHSKELERMRNAGKNRMSDRRRTTSRKNFLRLERLESRYALATASPVAVNDFYHDLVNQPLEIPAAGILSNDSSPSGAPLSAGMFSGPSHGTLEVSENGSFVYTPEA